MIIRNLLFPPKCVFCKKVLPVTHRIPNICPDCEEEIMPIPINTCKNCGKPRDLGFEKPYCMYCAKQTPDLSPVISNFIYEPKVRQSILRFKFGDKPYYAKTYAHIIHERLKAYGLESSFDAIVPAPISLKRLIKRGYNQTYLLAKALSKHISVPVVRALKKTRHTPPQSTLSRKERLKNIKGSISPTPNSKVYERALFLDDVYTTGATAWECTKQLKKMGFKKVIIATIAMNTQEE